MSLDQKDKRIIKVLEKDPRSSFVSIAKATGISEAAVRRRIKLLVSEGTLEFRAQMKQEQGASGLCLVAVETKRPTADVALKLKQLDSVQTVYETTGQFDIAVVMAAGTIREINACVDEIRRTEGVISTNTSMILRTL
jgi:Lrp/AsnC family transcriptional regulator of lysine biosynthesis